MQKDKFEKVEDALLSTIERLGKNDPGSELPGAVHALVELELAFNKGINEF